jgi:hypothetical protein
MKLHLAVVLMAIGQGTCLAGQTSQPTEAEKVLAAQIKCEDWTKNANGFWTSGPAAKVGGMTLSNSTLGVTIDIGNADLIVVLNQKCGGKPL